MKNAVKKLIAAAAVAAAASSLFAAVELGAGVHMTPYNSVKIEGADSFYELVPHGVYGAATFYFGAIRPFNVGLNLGFGSDCFYRQYPGFSAGDIRGGINSHFSVGPAFRFAVPGTRSSFLVSPGFKFNYMGIKYEAADGGDGYDVLFSMELGFHLDAGYTFWVVQNERFGVGLNFGADYSIGLGRAGFISDIEHAKDVDAWYDVEYAHYLKLYTGVTFRLGT